MFNFIVFSRPIMNNTTSEALASALSIDDPSFFILQQKEDSKKCNTPELQRKNLFDVAKTTVDKVKTNIKIKRRELIHMMYSSHEENSDENIDRYKLFTFSIISMLFIFILIK